MMHNHVFDMFTKAQPQPIIFIHRPTGYSCKFLTIKYLMKYVIYQAEKINQII